MALDYGSGASGAMTGAYAGSTFGPAGTVAGGVIGGVAGLFGKKKKKPKKLSRFDDQQKKLYRQKYDSLYGQGPFSDLYNFDAEQANQVFDKNVARYAYRDFNENVIPGITGQFRNDNIMNSSYTGEALGRAGRDVQESLDAQRAKMNYEGQQSAQQRKYDSIDNMLRMQTFDYQKPDAQSKSFIDSILEKIGPDAAEWFADYLKKGGKPSPTS